MYIAVQGFLVQTALVLLVIRRFGLLLSCHFFVFSVWFPGLLCSWAVIYEKVKSMENHTGKA